MQKQIFVALPKVQTPYLVLTPAPNKGCFAKINQIKSNIRHDEVINIQDFFYNTIKVN